MSVQPINLMEDQMFALAYNHARRATHRGVFSSNLCSDSLTLALES